MSNSRMNQTPDIPANGNHTIIIPHLHNNPPEKEYTVELLKSSEDVLWQFQLLLPSHSRPRNKCEF